MDEILKLVREYAEKTAAAKTWTAGKDFVNYAGAYYDADEYTAGVKSLLNGWLAMGDELSLIHT